MQAQRELLAMRRARPEDMMTYFRWVNDEAVRRNSYASEPVPIESHKAWFERKIISPDSFLYILEHDGEPAGQIRFDVHEGIAYIGFSIDSAWRGCGLGIYLLVHGTELFRRDSPEKHPVHGAVKMSNIPSLKAFAAAGFDVLKETEIESEKSVIFIYPDEKNEG